MKKTIIIIMLFLAGMGMSSCKNGIFDTANRTSAPISGLSPTITNTTNRPSTPTTNKTPETSAIVTQYAVTFNSNGGSNVASQMIKSGSLVSKPITPTKEGYTFAGWYSDAALTKEYNFNSTVTKNITLYAKWTEAYNVNNIYLTLGTRTYYSNGLGFEATFTNRTGVTIKGITDVTIKLYVNNILRANGYWSKINIGTLSNNSSIKMEITFGFDTIDKDWWNANRGELNIYNNMSYNVVR